MADPATTCPDLRFTTHPSVSAFNVSLNSYLTEHANSQYAYIATGALVFDTCEPNTPRILLLQRSAHDSMPNQWEVAGGGCDEEDETILHGVARELWEEAGLKATRIGPRVGDLHFFTSRTGKKICRFTFVVEAETLDVKLDPNEHQDFVWASEEDVKGKKVGDMQLEFTTQAAEDIILESFQHIRGVRKDT